MSKNDEFKFTLEMLQRLLETCIVGRGSFPKKWGEKAIPDDEQLVGREDIGSLLTSLRSYSPWFQGVGDDFKSIFGDKIDWYPADKAGKRLEGVSSEDERIASWKMKDQSKVYNVKLGREAVSGVVWCCILRLHPYCIIPATTKDAVDIWWPMSTIVRKEMAVRKYIGIAAAKRVEWENDPDPEPEKKV